MLNWIIIFNRITLKVLEKAEMELILYHRQYCPYSKKVRNYIEENQLQEKILYRDVEEDLDAMERLVRLTGGLQAPCLVINGRPKLSCDNIISWLKENLVMATPPGLEPGSRP